MSVGRHFRTKVPKVYLAAMFLSRINETEISFRLQNLLRRFEVPPFKGTQILLVKANN